MEKSFATDDHTKLIEASGGSLFQYFDRSDRLTKTASDAISRIDVQNHMPPDSHFGVHLITMGAEQIFGANRNGDSASIESLRKYHPTFEKFGCVFKEHKNRCQRTQGIGQVKLARYNEKMHRGELIVWVDKDKAPDLHKKASAGKELSWSMSMRLPYDECSCCHNKSPRVDQYCNHLKNNMLGWDDDFKKFAYARNEEGVKFFDISNVKRRADRIATYLGYMLTPEGMAKAAAAHDSNMVITGAQWAEHQFGPSLAGFSVWEDLTLEKLAAADEFVRCADSDTLVALARMAPATLTDDQVAILARPDFRSTAGELAKRAMFLDFTTFAAIITGRKIAELQKDASIMDIIEHKLPGMLQGMLRDGGCNCGEEALASVAPDDTGCAFTADKDSIDRLMGEVGDDLGMKPDNAARKAINITIVKAASVRRPNSRVQFDPFMNTMAEAYMGYIVKSAHVAKSIPEVSENTMLRVLAASLAISPQKGCHSS